MNITGRATVYGLAGAIAYTGVASPSTQLLTSAGFTKDAEFKDALIHPETAERIGGAYARQNIAGDIEFIPVAVTGAQNTIANARLALKMPDIPFKLTLSGFVHADLNGDYMCEGPMRTDFAAGDTRARVTMRIQKYTASGSDATTLTTVIA